MNRLDISIPDTQEGFYEMLDLLRLEMSIGTKFYHPDTGFLLTRGRDVTDCIVSGGKIIANLSEGRVVGGNVVSAQMFLLFRGGIRASEAHW